MPDASAAPPLVCDGAATGVLVRNDGGGTLMVAFFPVADSMRFVTIRPRDLQLRAGQSVIVDVKARPFGGSVMTAAYNACAAARPSQSETSRVCDVILCSRSTPVAHPHQFMRA